MYNVENISNTLKAIARINKDKVYLYRTSNDFISGHPLIEYNSIQVFANHWRFIEEKPEVILKPAVIEFIKSFIFLNNINPAEIKSIRFDEYVNYDYCVISGLFKTDANAFELSKGLIDFDLIEDTKDYTLEELGIK